MNTNPANSPKPASPQETAGRIAALHGAKPSRTSGGQLIGTKQVNDFINGMTASQASARTLKLNLG
jgi:hypothetical protein